MLEIPAIDGMLVAIGMMLCVLVNPGELIMKSRQESLNLLADQLEASLNISVHSAKEPAVVLPDGVHPDVYDVLCNVEHFSADCDLRQRDVDYKEMQEKQIRLLISELRKGAPLSELMRYNCQIGRASCRERV